MRSSSVILERPSADWLWTSKADLRSTLTTTHNKLQEHPWQGAQVYTGALRHACHHKWWLCPRLGCSGLPTTCCGDLPTTPTTCCQSWAWFNSGNKSWVLWEACHSCDVDLSTLLPTSSSVLQHVVWSDLSTHVAVVVDCCHRCRTCCEPVVGGLLQVDLSTLLQVLPEAGNMYSEGLTTVVANLLQV